MFRIRTDVKLPEEDEVRNNPLSFTISTRSRTITKTLTVLDALCCHISLHYQLTGADSVLGDEHALQVLDPSQPAFVEENVKDLAEISSPTRSVQQRTKLAEENPHYHDDDVLLANTERLKHIQSAYIKKASEQD